MQARLIESELLTAAIIIDERGRAVVTSNHMKPQHLADREYFTVHVAQDTGQLHISQPVHGRVSGRWTILMSRRINKPDGSFAGVVAIGVDPGYFTRFYGQTDLGRQGLATLVRLDGIVLAPRVGDALSFGQDISNSSLFVERANDPSGSIRTMGKLEGIRRFVGFRSLSEYPLVVAVGTAESEVLTSFHERRFRYTGVAALVSAAIAAFAGLLMFALARTRQTLGRSIQSEARLVQDIASRKRSEQALVESESRFRQVTKNIEDVFFLTKIESARMLYVSPAYERIWARTCRSLYDDPCSWAEYIVVADRGYIKREFRSNTDKPFDYEYRIVRPGGDTRWIRARGFVLAAMISDRRTAPSCSSWRTMRSTLRALPEPQYASANVLAVDRGGGRRPSRSVPSTAPVSSCSLSRCRTVLRRHALERRHRPFS